MKNKPGFKKWISLFIVLSATFISILNVFSSTVAIPVIQQDLSPTGAQMQFILASYNFFFGIFLIVGGRLGDKYGRKRMFLFGIGLFTLSSLFAGLAPNVHLLILMRSLQGVGAAWMIPQVLSIIQVSFSGKERGIALGAYASVGGFASTIAQLLGGWFIAMNLFQLGWRMIYLIHVPIGALAFALAIMFVDESRLEEVRKKRIDFMGTFLLTFALLTLSIPLTFGTDLDWPIWGFVSLLFSPLIFWGFVRYEQRLTQQKQMEISPLIQLSLFNHKSFLLGNFLVLLFYSGNAILFLALPLLLQNGLGVTAFTSGVIFTPLALGFAITSLTGGSLAAKLGQRTLTIGAGLLLLSYIGFFLTGLLFQAQLTGYEFMPVAFVSGIAMGLLSAPINFVSLEQVENNEVGSASGILSANVELAYAIGTVLASLLFLQFTGDMQPNDSPTIIRTIYLNAFHTVLALLGGFSLLMVYIIRKIDRIKP